MRDVELRMVDPDGMRINDTGYQALYQAGDWTGGMQAWARAMLLAITDHPKFTLHTVHEHGLRDARERLAEHEWLRKALKAGPIDPVPLPPKLAAVQQFLF